MGTHIRIQTAQSADIEAIARIRQAAILAATSGHHPKRVLQKWAANPSIQSLREGIADGCVLIATDRANVLACAGLHIDNRELVELFVAPSAQGFGLGRKLVAGIERLAVQFGLLHLRVCAAEPAIDFYHACGYRPVTGSRLERDRRTGIPSLHMHRRFPQRQTRFGRKLATLGQELGIPADYGVVHRLRFQTECREPVSIGHDSTGRLAHMERRAADAWLNMRAAAMTAGIELQAVSAFRTVAYQAGIIRKKLAAGQEIDQILKVSAAPGYSEHHSGFALDITTPGCAPLAVEFDRSPAYRWLAHSAAHYNFRLSYPRNNRHGLAYEPWHWCWYA